MIQEIDFCINFSPMSFAHNEGIVLVASQVSFTVIVGAVFQGDQQLSRASYSLPLPIFKPTPPKFATDSPNCHGWLLRSFCC
jgi:hypothetical protein